MNNDFIDYADTIGMFCRLKMNVKLDIPIRSSEMGVLIFTQKQNTAVTPLMISQFFKITKPSVTSMINSLVKNGYLLKVPSEVDKRSYALRMTNKGNKLVEATFIEYFKSIALLRENMGKSKFNQFIELMQMANGIIEEAK